MDGINDILHIENSSSLLPCQNQNLSSSENGNKTGTKNTDLLVYSRRKLNSKKQGPNPLQGHESELREKLKPGNNQSDSLLNSSLEPLGDSIQSILSASTESFDDLNIPIATHKGVQSCTKHPTSNYVL